MTTTFVELQIFLVKFGSGDIFDLVFCLLFEWRVDGRWRNHCNTYLTLPPPLLLLLLPAPRPVRAPSVAQLTQNSPKGGRRDRRTGCVSCGGVLFGLSSTVVGFLTKTKLRGHWTGAQLRLVRVQLTPL